MQLAEQLGVFGIDDQEVAAGTGRPMNAAA